MFSHVHLPPLCGKQELTAAFERLVSALAAEDVAAAAEAALRYAYYWCGGVVGCWVLAWLWWTCEERGGPRALQTLLAHLPPLRRYNFMPLARGSALCGYVAILGAMLAAGAPVCAAIPQVCAAVPRNALLQCALWALCTQLWDRNPVLQRWDCC